MIKLFNKKRANISSISIPSFNWVLNVNAKTEKQWLNPDHTIALSINYFDVEPDIPTIKNEDLNRKFQREMASQSNGGLIQADLLDLKGFSAARVIVKIPQSDKGTTYITSLIIPFSTCSFVIRIVANETINIKNREEVIRRKLLRDNVITLEKKGYGNWEMDPYLNDYAKGTLMNRSEEDQYDDRFPLHPLTQSRKLIAKIENEIMFTEIIGKLSSFKK